MSKTSLVIHGHFYQPPRENPWTEVVEAEPSAAPFHDWNERIYRECYRANDNARIMAPDGTVRRIVSNYHNLSFNFGPTLLSWMETRHPHGYARIVEADKESARLRSGHGNAIAQAYNHCILPLCNERDRRTQIRWGVAEFRASFGREPESLWLPETAVNDAVLADLIDEGLRYVVLAPRQCLRVRPLGSPASEWKDVSDGSVDPGLAYKYLAKDGSGRSIALFFYDGAVAQAIAFEEGLRTSQSLVSHFNRSLKGAGRLVHVATDGESYGHHTKFGDRTLAYALLEEAGQQGFQVSNYGEYLAAHPPRFEAQLAPGPGGEGTSWSCAHGVGRWIRDCGCHTGGQPGWNQAWRGPLRHALDGLRDTLAAEFARAAAPFFRDPWLARDAFIQVVLDPADASKARFLEEQASRNLSPEEKVRAFSLLDMQRQCMLMYTSCGWFFNDLSGLETVQILKYACRALDYAQALGLEAPKEAFLAELSEASSNLPGQGSGADIFRRQVEPLRVTPRRMVAHLAMTAMMEGPKDGVMGAWRHEFGHFERMSSGRLNMATGRLSLEGRVTGERFDGAFVAVHLGGLDLHCAVRPFTDEPHLAAAAAKVEASFLRARVPGLLNSIRDDFGGEEFGLDQLLPDGRDRLSRAIFRDLLSKVADQTFKVYEENRHLFDSFQASGFPLPAELRVAAEFTFSKKFEDEVRAQAASHDPAAYARAVEIAREAARLGYRIDRASAERHFTELINEAVRQALLSPDSSRLQVAIELLKLTTELGLTPDLEEAQEAAARAGDVLHAPDKLMELAGLLRLEPGLLVHLPTAQRQAGESGR